MAKGAKAALEGYEKLGVFYLGRPLDPATGEPGGPWLLYDSKDLTTHAVCVGMTGSGKTGLCLTLLEEAAIDGVPAIAIDPKGDLGNLLLTFPKLRPGDFEPWIDPAEAARQGASVADHAAATAARWREGLASWGQDGGRIARLRDAVDLAIYTPGGRAGLPLGVLQSFAAPVAPLGPDALADRVASAASGLLALLGIAADPLRSREHILISNLLSRAWQEGRGLDLAALVAQVQAPPLQRLGVVDLETFYPARDRAELAMGLNALLAAPGFGAWLEGEPLSVERLLWTPEGQPRVSIVSIAHLSDAERMFFLTLLLNEVVAWMRTQPGTASLRAIVYMDEVAGYLPPVAMPPSKPPLLTLLKQARAYGLGTVLATQNPVDLDYKALSNAGTWFLGRLQTERDKARVLEGLEGAAAGAGRGFDRATAERTLAGLRSRVFLMHDVHEDQPVLFHTRWALSYLRGPLTSAQIGELMRERREAGAAAAAPAAAAPAVAEGTATAGPPPLPAEIPQVYLGPEGAEPLYRPALLGVADLHFADARSGLDEWTTVTELVPLAGELRGDVWKGAETLAEPPELGEAAAAGARFAELPAAAARAKSYATWEKQLATHLYRRHQRSVWSCKSPKLASEPDEDRASFAARVQLAAHEERDLALEKLRGKHAARLERARAKLASAEERLGREQSQHGQQQLQTAISMGATVLGALFGRRKVSVSTVGRATTAMRGAGRVAREKQDVALADRRLAEARESLAALERSLEDEAAKLAAQRTAPRIAERVVRPRKGDIAIRRVALAWRP